jgi:hypothetical protein
MSDVSTYSGITAPRWGKEENERQIVRPKKQYVYGTGRNNALLHKVDRLELRWWTCGPTGAYVVRLESPRIIAVTVCGQHRFIGARANGSRLDRLCSVPKPDTVLCGRCHGKGVNFPHGRPHDIPLAIAKARLGCADFLEAADRRMP